MCAYPLSRDDLIEHLREQLAFLEASSGSYDAGFEGEAKRLGTVLRILVHDTERSASVLKQLGVKEAIRYLDTSEPINPRNLLATPGLVIMRMQSGIGGSYVAPLGDRPAALVPRAKMFTPWWTAPVTRDRAGRLFSRQDYALALSNKEGGAHVDPKLTSAYAELSRNNSLGWLYSDDRFPQGAPFDNNPALPSVRLIAYEIVLSLRAQLMPLSVNVR